MRIICAVLLVFGFSLLSYAGEVRAAVAANVSYAIEELKSEFAKTNPETKVDIILGSSGKLTAQIKKGAPFDLFMSANMKYPNALREDKIAITEPIVYAQGALAAFTVRDLPLENPMELLLSDKVAKIAIANPKTAPYGKAALDAFKAAGIYEKIEKKLVFAESITQSVQYAMTATDIGFIAKSTLFSPKMDAYKEGKNWVDVDSTLYIPIKQGIVLLKHGAENREAKAFYDFMLSKRAKKIFKAYGYMVDDE